MVDESWEVSGRIMTRLGLLDGIKKNDLLVQLTEQYNSTTK
jgi:hypothetical protein